jgi:hypothetical protein
VRHAAICLSCSDGHGCTTRIFLALWAQQLAERTGRHAWEASPRPTPTACWLAEPHVKGLREDGESSCVARRLAADLPMAQMRAVSLLGVSGPGQMVC